MGLSSKALAKVDNIISKIPLPRNLYKDSPRKKRRIILVLFLAILLGGVSFASSILSRDAQTAEYTDYEVQKGSITVSISGTGTVEPINQYDIVALVTGKVLSDTFNEGDTVEEGQLLFSIDPADMEKTLERANISYEKAIMSYQNTLESYNGLTVTSPIAGRITELYVAKGDNIQTGGKIASVVDDTYMTAKVPFNINDVESLYVNQPVSVTVENTFEVLSGTITKIYNSRRVLDGYITVSDIEVTLENPGALSGGTYVTVNAGGIDCQEAAVLESVNERIVTSKTSGTVSNITAAQGEYLNRGGEILRLTSESADDTLRSSELSLREAELSYQSSQDQLDNYSIMAPISGSVISKEIKAGDTLDSSTSKTVMAVIADMSTMVFTIDVDELDIASMKKGQAVNITADALSGKRFRGFVDNIGLLGTSQNGVTSYPVTIVIENGEGLWPGMNVTADIVIDSAENVLTIPVSAVNRGNTVLVKGAQGSEDVDQSRAPSGASYVQVELGLNDESYIEITKGLSEKDVVLVPAVKTQTGNATAPSQGQGAGMMPGAGGGIPSGTDRRQSIPGAPSGGGGGASGR
ncbi:MAG: HlyD family efflux transporter periplasmic adaptor subunit [Peptostreptococcales bacterium]